MNLDSVGPLPNVRGLTHLLTMIDRASRWVEVVPIKDTKTVTIVEAFIDSWCQRYGVPSIITTDQGPQFVSQLWKTFAESLGINLIHTTAYHPQSNGMIERFHRCPKASLTARLQHAEDWVRQLPWVLLGSRSLPNLDTSKSAAQMLFGQQLTLPGTWSTFDNDGFTMSDKSFVDNLQQLLKKNISQFNHHNDSQSYKDLPGLDNARFVFVRKGQFARKQLTPPYAGPYEIVSRHKCFYKIRVGRKIEAINKDRLKPAVIDESKVIVHEVARRPPEDPSRSRGSQDQDPQKIPKSPEDP